MCGIWCSFSCFRSSSELIAIYESYFMNKIKSRGPNYHCTCTCINGIHHFAFAASVLWLQGKQATKQPINSTTSTFCYNGDIFNIGIDNDRRLIEGDTPLVNEIMQTSQNVSEALIKLEGPYAFVFLDKTNDMLFFGRDMFGRRSLLIGFPKDDKKTLILTSVAFKSEDYSFIELPAIGTFQLDLKTSTITLLSWNFKHKNFGDNVVILESFLKRNIRINDIPQIELIKFEKMSDEIRTLFEDIAILDTDDAMNKLSTRLAWFQSVETLHALLKEAVRKRIENQPQHCANCIDDPESSNCNHCRVGVLFSGGLDCTLLAVIVDTLLDKDSPIDLINVSFDESRSFQSPDRVTGLASFQELQSLRPDRKWRFVSVDVTNEELCQLRHDCVCHLIYPLNSILDDSLGCALWFASRAQGSDGYTSPCRVLVVGMGADELCGGYTRHRNALRREGWKGLHDVLNEDWQNISVRNLARDDRVVSHHGRQLRTPYLDEDVVIFLRSLQPWQKTYPTDALRNILGDKLILRTLAFHLGLKRVAGFKKRALQFGSRIANSKENGNDVSPRL